MFSGDVEVNSGLENKDKNVFLNLPLKPIVYLPTTISNYFFLNSYNSPHKFDIICLSETCDDSNTPLDDGNLEISACRLVRSDHLPNTKRIEVSVCTTKATYL